MERLIKKYSNKYGIPVGLIKSIIEAESSGNTYAMRYEKNWRWFDEPLTRFHWHESTERQAQKFSWGLMQIMGAVARERGFEGSFISELTKPELGIKFGCKHLKWNYERYGNWTDVISAYNQGNNRKDDEGNYENQNYVDKVLRHWK